MTERVDVASQSVPNDLGLSLEDLTTILVSGFKSAFVPFRQKQVLLLRVNEGLTYKEIAARLELSPRVRGICRLGGLWLALGCGSRSGLLGEPGSELGAPEGALGRAVARRRQAPDPLRRQPR